MSSRADGWVGPPVAVRALTKRYGDVIAVDEVSFEVAAGEVFGLLGPNGSGKTTTLECLEGLRRPTGGEISVCGVDPRRDPGAIADIMGVQLQAAGLPPTMTPNEAIRFFAAYHRVAPRPELLDRFGLIDHRDVRYENLSTGLQRRLNLALAIAHDPPVVILDEPTAGLDVSSRSELHTAITELSEAGRTILLATHDMAEAEKLTDRVAILLRGRIVAIGSPRELTGTADGRTKVSVRTERMTILDALESQPGIHVTMDEGYAITFTSNPGPLVASILDHASAEGDPLIDLRVERPSLEERFLEITEVTA